jgi:DNA-binding IscR family transcriptional regulator
VRESWCGTRAAWVSAQEALNAVLGAQSLDRLAAQDAACGSPDIG